jgi:hypothetical protein
MLPSCWCAAEQCWTCCRSGRARAGAAVGVGVQSVLCGYSDLRRAVIDGRGASSSSNGSGGSGEA